MIWMLVDLDDNELPLIVADSASELAEKCHVSKSTITSRIANAERSGCRSKYVRIEVTE